jgi:hypothetical protein
MEGSDQQRIRAEPDKTILHLFAVGCVPRQPLTRQWIGEGR